LTPHSLRAILALRPSKLTLRTVCKEAYRYVVINHLHLDIPVDQILDSVREEFVPLLSGLKGFRHYYLVKEAEDRATVLAFYETAEDAANGAADVGPTYFAKHIALHLAGEQLRTAGEVVVQASGSPGT